MKSFYMKQPYADEQVLAIIDGRKTLLVEPIKKALDIDFGCELSPCEIAGEINGGNLTNSKYKVGERYWLKEAYGSCVYDFEGASECDTVYRADYIGTDKIKWFPSTTMSQELSRFTIEVTRVYVKRVRDITAKERAKASESTGISESSWHFNDWCWFVEFKSV